MPTAKRKSKQEEIAPEEPQVVESKDQPALIINSIAGYSDGNYSAESLRAAPWRSNLPFARHHDRFGDCFVAKSAPRNDIHSSFDVCLSSYSTPTFLVNGQPVVGAQPFEVFQQTIEALLK